MFGNCGTTFDSKCPGTSGNSCDPVIESIRAARIFCNSSLGVRCFALEFFFEYGRQRESKEEPRMSKLGGSNSFTPVARTGV